MAWSVAGKARRCAITMASDGAPKLRRCVSANARPRFGARGEEALHHQTAHAGLTSADMSRQERDARGGVAGADRIENGDVLVVRFADAVAMHEIESPHHADAV